MNTTSSLSVGQILIGPIFNVPMRVETETAARYVEVKTD